jgi:hypothetical protein
MPIRFKCPECGEKVALSEHLAGLHSHCTHCKSLILVPEPGHSPEEQVTAAPPPSAPPRPQPPPPVTEKLTAAPLPAPERRPVVEPVSGLSGMPRYTETDAPAGFFPADQYGPRPLAGSGAGWGPVRVGLLLLQIGMGLWGAGFLILLIAVVGSCALGGGRSALGAAAFPGGDGIAQIVVGLLFVGLMLLGTLVFLVGQGVCCAVPGRSRVRGLIIAALVCSLTSQGLSFVGEGARVLVSGQGGAGQQGEKMNWDANALGRGVAAASVAALVIGVAVIVLLVVGFFLLAAFLQGVGNYFGDIGLVNQAGGFIKHLATFIGVMVGLVAISCVPIIGLLVIALPFVFLIYVIALFIMLFNLLAATRSTVAIALAQG